MRFVATVAALVFPPPRLHRKKPRSASRSTGASKVRRRRTCRSTRATTRPRGSRVSIDPGAGSVEGINRVASALRDGLRRHQLARQVPRQPAQPAGEGGDDGVRHAGVFHRHAEEERHRKPKDLEGKVLGAPADGAYAQWPIFVQANKIDASGEDREHRLPGARADARAGQGRRHHRVLVLLYMNLKANGATTTSSCCTCATTSISTAT